MKRNELTPRPTVSCPVSPMRFIHQVLADYRHGREATRSYVVTAWRRELFTRISERKQVYE